MIARGNLVVAFVAGGLAGVWMSLLLMHISLQPGAHIERVKEDTVWNGVAVTLMPKRVLSPLLGVAKVRTIASALPKNWHLLIYTQNAAVHGSFYKVGRVRSLPPALKDFNAQRDILLSIHFWLDLPAPRVLWFEFGTTVACSSWPFSLDDFQEYDWVGAKWKWVKSSDAPHAFGGNGAFSLRSRDAMIAALRDWIPPARGNEDTIFVRNLFEDKDNRISKHLGRKPLLAPSNTSEIFAAEELFDSTRIYPPLGVYHLLRTVPPTNRTALLRACPEARLLFEPLHDPRCALRCPHDPTLLDLPLRVWKERCSPFPSDQPKNVFSALPPDDPGCQLTRRPPKNMRVGG